MATISREQIDAAIRMSYRMPLGVQIPLIRTNLAGLGVVLTEDQVAQWLSAVPVVSGVEQHWVNRMILWIAPRLAAAGHTVMGLHVPEGPTVAPEEVFRRAFDETEGDLYQILRYLKDRGFEYPTEWVQKAITRTRDLGVGKATAGTIFAMDLARIVRAGHVLWEATKVGFDPNAFASRWSTRLRGEWEHIRQRVNAVTENPADKARAARDRWVAKMTAAETHDRWDNALAGVTLAEWKASFKPELNNAFIASVDAAQDKVRAFGAWLSPNLDEIRAEVDAVAPPGVTIDQQAERARQWILAWRNRRYKG